MVLMKIRYEGSLRTMMTHVPSGSHIETDAPLDNHGKAERFSPTDLVGAALLSCIVTTMGIVAERDKISMEGVEGSVEKEMVTAPVRRIGALKVTLHLPGEWPEAVREKMERVAHKCPVHKSLHPEINVAIDFQYSV